MGDRCGGQITTDPCKADANLSLAITFLILQPHSAVEAPRIGEIMPDRSSTVLLQIGSRWIRMAEYGYLDAFAHWPKLNLGNST